MPDTCIHASGWHADMGLLPSEGLLFKSLSPASLLRQLPLSIEDASCDFSEDRHLWDAFVRTSSNVVRNFRLHRLRVSANQGI